MAIFATEALVDVWKAQMIFPDIPTVRQQMSEMEDRRIGLNIKLEVPCKTLDSV